jgi:hypothetical protein
VYGKEQMDCRIGLDLRRPGFCFRRDPVTAVAREDERTKEKVSRKNRLRKKIG